MSGSQPLISCLNKLDGDMMSPVVRAEKAAKNAQGFQLACDDVSF